MKLRVFDSPCRNCLFSPDKIVSDEQKEEILKNCLEKDLFFVCHKASERDYKEMTCCKSFFDRFQQAILPLRFAVMVGNVDWISQPDPASMWKIQPQERGGSYRFTGQCYTTKTVKEELSDPEIEAILDQLRQRVAEKNGADYLQVFIHSESQRKIYVIDNLSEEMLTGDGYTEEQKRNYNYFTILFAEEY